MSEQPIKDFRRGIDARKYFLSSPVGSLTAAVNCHISQGGEIEKRKAFVANLVPAPYAGKVYGLQPSLNGLYIFGGYSISAPTFQRSRTANVATVYIPNTTIAANGSTIVGTHINISGMGGVGYNLTNVAVTVKVDDGTYVELSYASTGPNEALTNDFNGKVIRTADVIAAPFIYQSIFHPSYSASGGGLFAATINGVISSTLFGAYPFILARFNNGDVIPYYNGLYVPDAALGLEFFGTDGNGDVLLDRINNYIASNVPAYTSTESAGVLDVFSVPTSLNGTPFTATVDYTSAAGSMVAAQQTTGQASTPEAQAVGSFQIVKAGSGTQATGTLTNTTDANPADAETVVVGSITYRFKTTPAAAYDVKRDGASRATTITNLALAINASGVAGTNYFAGTLVNPTVKATALNVTTPHYTIDLAAITGGTAGNSIALGTSSGGNLVRSAATLLGATDSKINQIVVNGATNLLSAPVTFSVDETTFASAVVAAINSNVASGYQATSNAGTVNVFAQVAGSTPNGYTVQVQSQGSVICGTGAFSLTGSGFTIDFIKANGVDLVTQSSLIYPMTSNQVLADFCRLVANSINAGTATHGYNAFCAQGSISVYIAKATTASTDQQQVLDISVTATVGQTGSAIPVTVTPLTVTLDTNAIAIGVGGKSTQVTATVAGGVAPYTYNWTQQGQNAIGIFAKSGKTATTTFLSSTNQTVEIQLRQYNRLQTQAQKASYLAAHPALQAYLAATQTNQVAFVCVVTDALGQIATSDPVYVTLLGQ